MKFIKVAGSRQLDDDCFHGVLGFARDAIVSPESLAQGWRTDAFFVAFKLPNLLRRIFC